MPVYVITGARTGIGLEYVRQLTESPANTVFAIVRSLGGDVSALRTIQQASPGGSNLYILECDISSATSIATLPSKILATTSSPDSLKINTLINNAGIMHSVAQTPFTLTPDVLGMSTRSPARAVSTVPPQPISKPRLTNPTTNTPPQTPT
jgi:NAD(P)-dependent dehydrogenase (short-subunit alcohol dehydrogenase family)